MRDAAEVLVKWPIGRASIERPIPSHWGKIWLVQAEDGGEYVLKLGKSPARVLREHSLLEHLRSRDLCVAVPLIAATGEPFATHDGQTLVLYPRLPGRTVENHYGPGMETRASAFGAALAALHAGLSSYPQPTWFSRLDLAEHVVRPALEAAAEHPEAFRLGAVRRIGEEAIDGLSAHRAGSVEQLVHRDPNPSNLLVDDGKVTGIVDFGVVTTCVRLLDPSYLAVTLLASGWGDARKTATFPELLAALLRGYGRSLDISQAERAALFHGLLAAQFIVMGFNLRLGNVRAARKHSELLHWLSDHRAELAWTR